MKPFYIVFELGDSFGSSSSKKNMDLRRASGNIRREASTSGTSGRERQGQARKKVRVPTPEYVQRHRHLAKIKHITTQRRLKAAIESELASEFSHKAGLEAQSAKCDTEDGSYRDQRFHGVQTSLGARQDQKRDHVAPVLRNICLLFDRIHAFSLQFFAQKTNLWLARMYHLLPIH